MQVVKSLVLIDAVCLLTCWPGLLYNFIYRKPACSLDGKGCLDVLRFICSRDLMIAEVSDPLDHYDLMCSISLYRLAVVCSAISNGNPVTTYELRTVRQWLSLPFDEQAFCRDFSWSALMLWPEDMPSKTIICMSGEDRLVPNSLILRHLRAVDSSAQAREYPHPHQRKGAGNLFPEWEQCPHFSYLC